MSIEVSTNGGRGDEIMRLRAQVEGLESALSEADATVERLRAERDELRGHFAPDQLPRVLDQLFLRISSRLRATDEDGAAFIGGILKNLDENIEVCAAVHDAALGAGKETQP